MRELIEPQSGGKRYAHSGELGHHAPSRVDVGRSLPDDLRRDANHPVPMGDSDFVAWVRSEMERRGISQRVVARRAGINHSGLSRLLRGGGGTMRYATAVALARALGGRLAVDGSHTVAGRCATCGHRDTIHPRTLVEAQSEPRPSSIYAVARSPLQQDGPSAR